MNVNEMTMKEMVAYYNEYSDKPVKRFSDRKTAERRIEELDPDLINHVGMAFCPHCGIHLSNGVTQHCAEYKNDDFEFGCLGCGGEWGKAIHNATLSEAIRASWKDPQTAAKRRERSGVKVNGDYFKSVAAAFRAFGLPMNEHIKFRMELKKNEKMTAYDKKWEIITLC